MIVERKSIVSGKVNKMDINITPEQLFNFISGRSGLAQEAFPDLSLDEREFIAQFQLDFMRALCGGEK